MIDDIIGENFEGFGLYMQVLILCAARDEQCEAVLIACPTHLPDPNSEWYCPVHQVLFSCGDFGSAWDT